MYIFLIRYSLRPGEYWGYAHATCASFTPPIQQLLIRRTFSINEMETVLYKELVTTDSLAPVAP